MVNYSKSLLLLAAGIAVFVVQTAGFVIAVDYFGYFGAVAIPCLLYTSPSPRDRG